MNWLRNNSRVAVVVGLTLALPVVLIIYLALSLLATGWSYQNEIDRLEPRIARLMGAKQSEEQLLAAARNSEARILNLVYSSSDDTDTVSAALQKNVRGIMSGAGLVVADSRIESAKREGAFDVIGLAVSVNGSIDALDAALSDIVTYTPLLLVTDIDVMAARTLKRRGTNPEQQNVAVKLHLLALRGVE